MTTLTETIHQAAVDAYWKCPEPSHITAAVVAATGCRVDFVRVNRIVEKHLAGPNFVAMAQELAVELREAA